MKHLKRSLLLNKRFLRKAGFVMLLILIPLFAVLLNIVASKPHGIVSIALYGDQNDTVYVAVRDHLTSDESIVTFTEYNDAASAEDAVRYGECDGAWIFSGNTSEILDKYIAGSMSAKPVTVIERTDTVALRLAREKLSAALSPQLAEKILRDDYRANADPDADDEMLARYYDSAFYAGDIFRFVNIEGSETRSGSYLTYPVRGFLAVAVLLCGLTLAMYWNRDERSMVFSGIPVYEKPVFSFIYHFTGIIDVGIVSLASLYICRSGDTTPAGVVTEIVSMLLLCVSCAVLSILLGMLIKPETVLATVSALTAISQLIVNPVFIDVSALLPVRLISPVYYYIRSADSRIYLLYLLIYTAVVSVLTVLISFAKRKASPPMAEKAA